VSNFFKLDVVAHFHSISSKIIVLLQSIVIDAYKWYHYRKTRKL